MAIGRIGGSSYGYDNGYYARLNRVKLEQALQKNARYQESLQGVGATQDFRPVEKVSPVSLESDLKFLEKYTASMVGVMESASTLRFENRGGVMSDLTVGSSDMDVAEAVRRNTLRSPKDMTISVDQIAVAQRNISQGITGDAAAAGDLAFTVTDGRNQTVQVAVLASLEDGSARTGREMLEEAARQINDNSAMGVRAAVESRDGVARLVLQSKETGKENAFEVSETSQGVMGLEQAQTEAQDAKYSVKEGKTSRTYESASNDVMLDYGNIGLALKSKGTAVISSRPDEKKVTEAFGELIDSFNQAVSLLNEERGRGTGVASQQRSFQQGIAPTDTLSRMGVKVNQDGTLTLDKSELEKRLREEPGLTNELVGGNFSIAQTAFRKADAALRTSADSLINNHSRSIGMGNFTGTAQMVNNYAGLGLMIDYLI